MPLVRTLNFYFPQEWIGYGSVVPIASHIDFIYSCLLTNRKVKSKRFGKILVVPSTEVEFIEVRGPVVYCPVQMNKSLLLNGSQESVRSELSRYVVSALRALTKCGELLKSDVDQVLQDFESCNYTYSYELGRVKSGASRRTGYWISMDIQSDGVYITLKNKKEMPTVLLRAGLSPWTSLMQYDRAEYVTKDTLAVTFSYGSLGGDVSLGSNSARDKSVSELPVEVSLRNGESFVHERYTFKLPEAISNDGL